MRSNNKRFFTSAEAGDICGLASSTIRRWVQQGQLKAFRTPGGNIRIMRKHLIDFLREFNIPATLSSEATMPILLVHGHDKGLVRHIIDAAAGFAGRLQALPTDDDAGLWYSVGCERPRYLALQARHDGNDLGTCSQIRRLLAPEPVRIGMVVDPAGQALPRHPDSPEVVVVPGADPAWYRGFITNLIGLEDAVFRPAM